MDRVFSFLLWPKRFALGPWKRGRKKRGSITCHTDRANEANKMFIIWLCWLFRFWKGDRELEVHTATYGPGIDQSQHAKSFSHIIMRNIDQPVTHPIQCQCRYHYMIFVSSLIPPTNKYNMTMEKMAVLIGLRDMQKNSKYEILCIQAYLSSSNVRGYLKSNSTNLCAIEQSIDFI